MCRDADDSVTEFLEKPSSDEIDTNLISAGAYVIEREVLDSMAPAGTKVSIERDVFPELVGKGLYGYEADGYWLDIGTPERYLQATYDILEGEVETEVGRRSRAPAACCARRRARVAGSVHAPALVGAWMRRRGRRDDRRPHRARRRRQHRQRAHIENSFAARGLQRRPRTRGSAERSSAPGSRSPSAAGSTTGWCWARA